MKLISIHLNEKQLEVIKKLVKEEYYPNKSEAIKSLLNIGLLSRVFCISKDIEEYEKYFNEFYKEEE